MAISGAPVSPNVELTIVGNGNLSNNYSNIFLRQSGVAAGYLVSAGEATGSNNNAAFYIDQYDGTSQTRRLSLAANGDFTVLGWRIQTRRRIVGCFFGRAIENERASA